MTRPPHSVIDLERHVARHCMKSPLQRRAMDGAMAAERMADRKDTLQTYRAFWQGEAFDPVELALADEIMGRVARNYEASVVAEWVAIDMERAAK